MEINILEEKKNKLVFEIKGENHTMSNLLTKELWKDSKVKVTGYNIAHPLVGVPKITVETDGEDPREVVLKAIRNIKKDCESFSKAFDKEF
jgi:DNA-directed RNA polymerase subunit L